MTVRFVAGTLTLAAALLLGTVRTPAVPVPSTDPLLPFSTLLGGTGYASSSIVALGPDGAVWLAARTDAPILMGVPRPRASPGEDEVAVLRLDPDDRRVLSLLWLGGDVEPAAFAFDSSGNAFLAGSTDSGGFPVTTAFGPGGNRDGIVVKIRSNGSAIHWAGRLGGTGSDGIRAIALTDAGDAIVAGYTDSTDFFVNFPIQAGLRGSSDGFIAMFRGDGTSIDYSTYFGGGGADYVSSLLLGSAGIVVTGTTDSTEFAGMPVLFGGPWAGSGSFLAEFYGFGQGVRRVALLGRTDSWAGLGLMADGPDRFLVWGATSAQDFPFPPPLPGTPGAFLLRLADADWSVLGGSLTPGISPYVASRGSDGTVWLAGSGSGPLPGAARPFPGGAEDVLAAAFSGEDLSQVYGTFLAGRYGEWPNGVAVAADGSSWVTGVTQSPDFPVTAPALGGVPGAMTFSQSFFLTHLLPGDPATRPAAPGNLAAVSLDDGTVRLSWEDRSSNETGFAVYRYGSDSLDALYPDYLFNGKEGVVRIAVVSGGRGEWVDDGVASNRTYGWSVQAINDSGGSDPSPAAVIDLPPTLSVSIDRGVYRPPHRRAEIRRRSLLLRGRLSTMPSSPGGVVDPREGGFEWKTPARSSSGFHLLSIPPGDPGWRREGRRWRWKSSDFSLAFDPVDGSFDLRVRGWVYTEFEAMQFTVGRHSKTIFPQWRLVGPVRLPGRGTPMRIP